MNSVEPLYQTTVKCAHCEHSFQTSRVRPSFKKGTKRDSDFCLHYKDPTVNPDFYVVRVCPICGFASTENSLASIQEHHKRAVAEKLSNHWTFKDYGGERTFEEALQTYKLALLCAQIVEDKDRVIAGILHHIAWLYRYSGNKEQEDRFLEYALDAYIRVFETEADDVNNARLMYLIGELSRRLKRYSDAIKWFGRVINDKRITDSGMIQLSREQWAQTREDMLQENMELPDEMQDDQTSTSYGI